MKTLVVCLTLFAAASVLAEVLELEGTVKSIDPDARTITIERKTPKGTKTLELEVNKKAGELSVLKVGEAVTLTYDPDLELVTGLGGISVDSVSGDLRSWQGEWLAIAGVANGKSPSRDELARMNRRLIVEGAKLTSERTRQGATDGASGTITLDAETQTFTFSGVKSSDSKQINWIGRYQNTDDTLTLVYRDRLGQMTDAPNFVEQAETANNDVLQYKFQRLQAVDHSDEPATAVAGVYDIEWTEPSGKKGTVNYELKDDGTFIRAGKPAGKWELADGVVQIRFDDVARGFAIVRFRSPDGLEGTHTKGDGTKSTWKGEKKK